MKLKISVIVLTLSLLSCSEDEVSNYKWKSIDPVKYEFKSSLNWMGHWKGEGQREDLVKEVAREFSFENQKIDVNLQFHNDVLGSGDKEAMANEIVKMIKTNKINWDVVWLDDDIYQLVAIKLNDDKWGAEHLVDFSNVPWFENSQKDFIISDDYYRNQTGGIVPGPYIEGYYYALWFNSELAEKLGLDIKTEEMTADDLLNYAKVVKAYNKKGGEQIGFFYESSNWTLSTILFQNLFFSEFNKKGSTRKSAMLKTFELFEELSKYDPLISDYKKLVWEDSQDYPLNGKCLFYVQGTWMYNLWMSIDAEKTKKMIPAELPVFNVSETYVGSYTPIFAVMKNSPNKQEGIDLLKYWSTSSIAETWSVYTKSPTGIKGNISNFDYSSDQFEKFQSHISSKYGKNVRYFSDVSYALESLTNTTKESFENDLINVLSGKSSAQEVYNSIYFVFYF